MRPQAWHPHHYLPEDARSVLDVGCNVGAALQYAHELGASRLLGIEINPQAAEDARRRLARLPGAEFQVVQGSADEMPFDDGAADAAMCCEVLEHVPEGLRKAAIREVARVLAPGAPFILTVPASGLFAALDPANARYRLPRLYRAVSRALGGRGRDLGYEGQKHGVVWHHHFSLEELRGLLEPEFTVETVRYRGALGVPVADWLMFPFYRLGAQENPIFKLLSRVEHWDMSIDYGRRFAYDVLVVARKARRSA